ncbi:hypothetical protein ABC304_02985 [Microbacterium sp. 1P10UB]|uniref:hypothetical protein n=1 Tax=unclassified Microbacterium TaxID=2609290 RepID=UPI0039A3E886
MTDLDTRNPADPARGLSRRSVMKGAAWSVPVIVASAAVPMAVASIGNLSASWTAQTTLLSVGVVGSASTVTAAVAITVPTTLTLANGSGPISGESASVTIVVQQASGVNVALGRVKGFGVRTFNGSTSGTRTINYTNNVGYPVTTFSSTVPVSLLSGASLNIPVEFGIAGDRTSLVNIGALTTFSVTTTITVGGRTLTAPALISVPVGAGIL